MKIFQTSVLLDLSKDTTTEEFKFFITLLKKTAYAG